MACGKFRMRYPNISTVSSRNRCFLLFSFDAFEHFKCKWKIVAGMTLPTHWEEKQFWHSQRNVSPKKSDSNTSKVCILLVTDYLQSQRQKKCCTHRQSERLECDQHFKYEWDSCFVWNWLLNPYEIMECNPINLNVLHSLLCSFQLAAVC